MNAAERHARLKRVEGFLFDLFKNAGFDVVAITGRTAPSKRGEPDGRGPTGFFKIVVDHGQGSESADLTMLAERLIDFFDGDAA